MSVHRQRRWEILSLAALVACVLGLGGTVLFHIVRTATATRRLKHFLESNVYEPVDPRIRSRTVMQLVRNGADVQARSRSGTTPLMLVTSYGSWREVHELIGAGAAVNARDSKGATALMWLGRSPDTLKTAEVLIEAGADVHARDNNGNPALMYAVEANEPGLVKALLYRGASVNQRNNAGESPLMRVRWPAGYRVILPILTEHGADLNTADADGMTLLMRAASMPIADPVRYLLSLGADVCTKTGDGATALTWSKTTGNAELVRLIRDQMRKRGCADEAQ